MRKEFLKVSELNSLIKEVVTYGFPSSLWICGEIQGFNRNRSKKHIFFELCEKNLDSKDIVARIGMVIFAGRKSYINEVLKNVENAFELKDDIEVKFLCKIDFYAPHGAVRLIVENIDPVYTLGRIAQQRQKLIAELKSKGTLEANKKIPLSPVPLKIGLITSGDSAAYNDFMSELKQSGFGFQVFFINSLMQGKKTEDDVCSALDRFNRMEELDAVVITRGGGSIAELSCFDSKKIAEKIASLRLPVLSGIGHEINITITDMTAHTFAKTPTAVAQYLVERIGEFITDVDTKMGEIADGAKRIVDEEKRRLKTNAVSLQTETLNFLKIHNQQIVQLHSTLSRQSRQFLKDKTRDVVLNQTNFSRTLKNYLQRTNEKVRNFEKIIDAVHPRNTMKRGFSVTRNKKGKVVSSTASIANDEQLITEVFDGYIQSKVNHVSKEGQSD